jgi:hypothetical protein
MKKIHFVGEWFDCGAPKALLSEPHAIRARCLDSIARNHLPISYEYFTVTEGDGVVGAMTGAGIHLVLRTFPDGNAVMANLYVEEGESTHVGIAMQAFDGLRDAFRPMRALLRRIHEDGKPLSARGRTPRAPTEVFLSKPVPRAV